MIPGAMIALRRVEKLIVAAEVAAISLALALMLLAVTWNVVDRTFDSPLPDVSPVALLAMSVLAFIGSAYAVYSGGHIVVDLGEVLPAGGWRRWTARVVDLAVLAFSAAILIYGGEFLLYVFQMGERTPDDLELPVWVPVGCLVGGAALSIFHVVCRFANAVADRNASRRDSTSPIAAEDRHFVEEKAG